MQLYQHLVDILWEARYNAVVMESKYSLGGQNSKYTEVKAKYYSGCSLQIIIPRGHRDQAIEAHESEKVKDLTQNT